MTNGLACYRGLDRYHFRRRPLVIAVQRPVKTWTRESSQPFASPTLLQIRPTFDDSWIRRRRYLPAGSLSRFKETPGERGLGEH
jgi:hypothetical protein